MVTGLPRPLRALSMESVYGAIFLHRENPSSGTVCQGFWIRDRGPAGCCSHQCRVPPPCLRTRLRLSFCRTRLQTPNVRVTDRSPALQPEAPLWRVSRPPCALSPTLHLPASRAEEEQGAGEGGPRPVPEVEAGAHRGPCRVSPRADARSLQVLTGHGPGRPG